MLVSAKSLQEQESVLFHTAPGTNGTETPRQASEASILFYTKDADQGSEISSHLNPNSQLLDSAARQREGTDANASAPRNHLDCAASAPLSIEREDDPAMEHPLGSPTPGASVGSLRYEEQSLSIRSEGPAKDDGHDSLHYATSAEERNRIVEVPSTESPVPQSLTGPTRNRTHRREVPEKTRAQLMGERPWRDGTPTPPPPRKASLGTANTRKGPPLTKPRSKNKKPWDTHNPPPIRSSSRQSTRSQCPPDHSPCQNSVVPTPHTMTPSAVTTVTPPPVLIRSPRAVLVEECDAWTDMVNQQANLEALRTVMRERERLVVRTVQKINLAEQTLRHLDTQLYKLRDTIVQRRGRDVNGNSIYPEESGRRAASRPRSSPGPANRGSRSNISPRLYPEVLTQNAACLYMERQPFRKSRSCLSDDDIDVADLRSHAVDLAKWRAERPQLLAKRARLAQQQKELRFHHRRGTDIKNLSAITLTSSRGPLERAATKSHSAIDASGYDVLVKLRLEEQQSAVAVYRAREKLITIRDQEASRGQGFLVEYEGMQNLHHQWKERHARAVSNLKNLLKETKQAMGRLVPHRDTVSTSAADAHDRLESVATRTALLAAAKGHVHEGERLLKHSAEALAKMEGGQSTPRVRRDANELDVFARLALAV